MPPSSGSGAIVYRKWLVILLSSSFALAVCSWLYRRTRSHFLHSCATPRSLSGQAWDLVQWFFTSPPSPPASSSSSNSPALGSHASSSTEIINPNISNSMSSFESDLETLSTSRISGNPRVVVMSTRNTLLTGGEGEAVDFLPGAVESLRLWLQKRRALDLYLITQCQDDATEERVHKLLLKADLKGLNLKKVLFCSSTSGLLHMARQLEPELLIDSCVDNLMAAKKWTRHCVLLGSDFPQPYSNLTELVNNVTNN